MDCDWNVEDENKWEQSINYSIVINKYDFKIKKYNLEAKTICVHIVMVIQKNHNPAVNFLIQINCQQCGNDSNKKWIMTKSCKEILD